MPLLPVFLSHMSRWAAKIKPFFCDEIFVRCWGLHFSCLGRIIVASLVEVSNALLLEGLDDGLFLPVFVEELVSIVDQDCLEGGPEFICDDRERLYKSNLLLQWLLVQDREILVGRSWVLLDHHGHRMYGLKLSVLSLVAFR